MSPAKPSRHAQRGDTIVEVLICIGVVGAVLAGAFVVSNRSQLAVRDSQERSQASKIVESQLELMRSNAKLQGGAIFDATTTFCMSRTTVRPVNNPTPDTSPAAECRVNGSGDPVPASAGLSYTVAIDQETAPGAGGVGNAGKLFRIQVSWVSVTGMQEKAQQTMYYRLYQ